MNNYDETYELLVNMARAKMIMNAHKGRIESVTDGELIEMAEGELQELGEACKEGDATKILEECADSINFVMGVAHRALHAYRNRKRRLTHEEIIRAMEQPK